MQTTNRPKIETKNMPKPVRVSSSGEDDIIKLILADHKPLKKLIKILKNADVSISDRRSAFDEFEPLLLNHAKPEEKTLYVFMKKDADLRCEGLEGETEHTLADQLINEIKSIKEEDLWSAKVKVLAELVEHHIEEEEDEMLPDFKKSSSPEERAEIGKNYLKLRSDFTPDIQLSRAN